MYKILYSPSLLIIFSLFLFACSSTKDTTKTDITTKTEISIDTSAKLTTIQLKKGLGNFEFSGEVIVKVNSDEFSGNFEGGYIEDDKLILNVFGPFGIHIASIEIIKDTLKIANLWHKKFYQNKININSDEINLTGLELSRKILLAEPLQNQVSLTTQKDTLYFKNNLKNGKIEYNYILTSNKLSFLELKIENNNINLVYSAYKKINDNAYPMEIVIESKDYNSKVKFELEDLKELKDKQKYKPIDYNKLQKVESIEKIAR